MTDKTLEGPTDWPAPDYRLNCRMCGVAFSGPKGTMSCWQCYNPRSVLPEEQAVIEAAEKCRDAGGGLERVSAMTAIHNTVDALRASRKPKGVKPEEVEPGTLFRFDPKNSEHGGQITFRLLGGSKNAVRLWLSYNGDRAYEFDANDLIIPIQEEGECEQGKREMFLAQHTNLRGG